MNISQRFPALVLSASLVLVAGCNTPQQRAYNKPAPIPPPQQQSQGEKTTGGPNTQSSEQQSQQAQTQQPPNEQREQVTAVEDCDPSKPQRPDVEITDVPLDKDGNPIEPITSASAQSENSAVEDCKTAAAESATQNEQAENKQSEQNQAQQAKQQASSNTPATSGQKAKTSEERKAAANSRLDQRLAAFDELMRRAEQAAARERQTAAGAQAGVSGGFGANQNMPESERGAGGQSDTASGLGHTPDESGETRSGDYQHTATGPIPADLPDGRDDDIVARQLREAASKESDPVLREKLWEEYRRYKRGL